MLISPAQFRTTSRLGQAKGRGEEGGGGTQQSLIRGGSAPRSNPLPFQIPFLTESCPLSIPSLTNSTPFTYLL